MLAGLDVQAVGVSGVAVNMAVGAMLQACYKGSWYKNISKDAHVT
jgi:hypothetical protein